MLWCAHTSPPVERGGVKHRRFSYRPTTISRHEADIRSDNAVIPDVDGTWSIDLVSDPEIDELTVEGSADFATGINGLCRLEVEKLTIDADAGEVVLTIAPEATIAIEE